MRGGGRLSGLGVGGSFLRERRLVLSLVRVGNEGGLDDASITAGWLAKGDMESDG